MKETDNPTKAEAWLQEAFPRGAAVDLRRAGSGRGNDVDGGARWPVARRIRAPVITELLLGGSAPPGSGAVLWVEGARIVGPLRLRHARIEHALVMKHCYFDEPADLSEAHAVSVCLQGSRLPSLECYGLRVSGDLDCRALRGGVVDVFGAQVGGRLWLAGAELGDPSGGYGLNAPDLTVGGGMYCRGLRAAGGVNLHGATIGSALELDGARLDSTARSALRAPGLVVTADMSCDGFSATGVEMFGARIGQNLWLNGARLDAAAGGAGHAALDAPLLSVGGGLYCNGGFRASGAVNLYGAKIGSTLEFGGAALSNPAGLALRASGVTVAAAMALTGGFAAEGGIDLSSARIGGGLELASATVRRGTVGARIDGSLDLVGARIERSPGLALDLGEAVIGGSVLLTADAAGRRPVIEGRVDLSGARIAGQVLVRDATLREPADTGGSGSWEVGTAVSGSRLSVGAGVALEGSCEVTGGLDLSMSQVSGVWIGAGCALLAPGRIAVDLTSAEVRSLLRLDQDARIEGTVFLAGAVVHGTLALHGQLSRPGRRSLVGGSGMTVAGDVYLDGLRASGGMINFRHAALGHVSARGARLDNPGGYSIRLSQAVIKGSVLLADGFTSAGLASISQATVEGRLELTGGSFTCPAPAPGNEHGHAIEAISATVRGGIDLGWAQVAPSVDFTGAATTVLADDPATWPPRFTIAGLTYDRFEKPLGSPGQRLWDPTARCAWLRRQATFDSGPYEQAARVFRRHGYVSEAEQILIAQRRHARRAGSAATWPRRAGPALYATVGYGYRPWRVLWILAALLVLVAASLAPRASQATMRATNGSGQLFTATGPVTPSAPAHASAQHADSCGNGAVRCFSPVLYAIDTVIPLISLDQRSTWYPDPHLPGGELMLWWLNLATLLGWLLSSVFVLSLARLSRNP